MHNWWKLSNGNGQNTLVTILIYTFSMSIQEIDDFTCCNVVFCTILN